MKARGRTRKPIARWRVLGLALALGVSASASVSAGPAAASIPQSAVYDVQIQGAVNGLPFARSGGMAIGPTTTAATTNGVNPVDLCLASGSPFISPERGAIWFATNGVCANANGARQDMAFVAANQAASALTIRPDPALSATGINGFNGASGFTAAVWQIFDGTMTLQFQGSGETVTATMQLLGTGAVFHSENTYNATLTGQARQLTPAPPATDTDPPAESDGASDCKKAQKKLKRAKKRVAKAKKRLRQADAAAKDRAQRKLEQARKKLRKAKRRKGAACADDAAARQTLESFSTDTSQRGN